MAELPCGCDHAWEDCLCGCEYCQEEDSNNCMVEGCPGGYFCTHKDDDDGLGEEGSRYD